MLKTFKKALSSFMGAAFNSQHQKRQFAIRALQVRACVHVYLIENYVTEEESIE